MGKINKIFRFVIIIFIYQISSQINYGYTEGIRVAWDYTTLTTVFTPHGWYSRMIRLENDDLLCSFVNLGIASVSRSTDNGLTWQEAIPAVYPENGIVPEVPELLQLQNGSILLAYNPRPPHDNTDTLRRFGIKVAISQDNGYNWEHLSDVYDASYQFFDGVWEPAMIQLESGEIQLYVANEFPYKSSDEQNISMFRSFDNGESWVDTVTLSFRAGYRDGMPVPLILNDNKGIIISIEDNGTSDNLFKPAIIHTTLEDNWKGGIADGNSERRWFAFEDENKIPDGTLAAAPYVRQLPTNETIISFQTNKEKNQYWIDRNQVLMGVGIGDESAKNFSRRSFPFNAPSEHGTWWNSLFIKDSLTVTAITGTDYLNYGVSEVISKDGRVISDIKAFNLTPLVDGILTDSVWSKSSEMFVGAYSSSNAIYKDAWDDNYFYISISVKDENLFGDSGNNINEDDGVVIYLDPKNLNTSINDEDLYKLSLSVNGSIKFQQGNGLFDWNDLPDSSIIKVIKVNGTVDNANDIDTGYDIEIAIPWETIVGRPTQAWGIHYQLINDKDGGIAELNEGISGNDYKRSYSWCRIDLLPKDVTSTEKIEQTKNTPKGFLLLDNYPNPFNPQTIIEYQLDKSEKVRLSIFNVSGSEIIRLVDSQSAAGLYRAIWDGKNSFGESMPSGIYFYRLEGETNSISKKMLLIK